MVGTNEPETETALGELEEEDFNIEFERLFRRYWLPRAVQWCLTGLASLIWAISIMGSWAAMFGLLYPVIGLFAIVLPAVHIVMIFLGPKFEGIRGQQRAEP
ncbi:MAG TPA: hypothetical protein PKA27_06720 [Fimbriimonadaceae bacterium]|nr:hypothetical protein [Fimbriimonadaceae bacterium]